MKCKLIRPWPAVAAPGEIESHYGFPMVVQEDGSLVGDIDDGMVAGEIEAGRMAQVDPVPTPTPAATKASIKDKE